ncbi:hypothetical protein F4604DRAFT_1682157 [Suillus subluteus]|nr:hypothetical protein F4604DRAFT_1682157 [Suillus subluteus]
MSVKAFIQGCYIRPSSRTTQAQYPYLANPASSVHRNATTMSCDYTVQEMQTNPAQFTSPFPREVCGHWEENTHPSGATYHYNKKCKRSGGLSVLLCGPGETYHFQECTAVWHWNHKRLELEAQFWKHVEYFPLKINISLEEVRALQTKLNWYCVGKFSEALALEKSTAASLFWTLDQMKEMASELAIADMVKLNTQGHHEYLNHYGQPEARVMRTHSLGKRCKNLENSPLMTGVSVAMFYIPVMVLKRLRDIYVDGLVSGVDIRAFTDDFSAQSKAQTTVASVIMAVDASILAIPGIFTVKFGLGLSAKIGCGLTLIVGAGLVIPLVIAGFGPGLIR